MAPKPFGYTFETIHPLYFHRGRIRQQHNLIITHYRAEPPYGKYEKDWLITLGNLMQKT